MQGVLDTLIAQGSSTINFLRQLGGAVGIGLVGNVLEWRLRTHAAEPIAAFHETFALVGAITACATVAAVAHGARGAARDRDPTRPLRPS